MNTALQHLASLEMAEKRRKYPNVPLHGLVKPKFNDKSTNDLTRCVIRCIELHGGYAVRIQTQGQYNETLGRWTKSHTRKGTADIHATIEGKHVSIEIKRGRKDRMSADQKKTAEQVRRAGGQYLIVSNYDSFWEWFTQFVPTLIDQKGGEQI